MTRSLQQMNRDCALPDNVVLRNELLRLQLASTLLRLSTWREPTGVSGTSLGSGAANFRRFRKLLEENFATQHQVTYYARALGMSEKNLSRACITATGIPTKSLINQRLALEAKRLLAHSSMAVQAVGLQLGFDEASNFVKFFRKETAATPLAFRKMNRPAGQDDEPNQE